MACPRFIEIDDSGKPKTAYFTDDLAEPIEHGRAMAAARAPTRPRRHRRAHSQRRSGNRTER
jgi:hypothetical protein